MVDETYYKPIYDVLHKWDTGWLGRDASVTDIDLAGMGLAGINIYEIKRRSPILTKLQRRLFITHQLFHLVITPSPSQETANGKYHFESLTYEVYCPYAKQDFDYIDHRRSWVITSPPQAYITHDEARAIFRGDAPWPCCGRPTFPK